MSSITGIGFLFGSIGVSIWGCPKPYAKTIFIIIALQGFIFIIFIIFLYLISFFFCFNGYCLGAIMTTGRMEPTVEIITITGFIYMFLTPFIGGCSDAIWYVTKQKKNKQTKVTK